MPSSSCGQPQCPSHPHRTPAPPHGPSTAARGPHQQTEGSSHRTGTEGPHSSHPTLTAPPPPPTSCHPRLVMSGGLGGLSPSPHLRSEWPLTRVNKGGKCQWRPRQNPRKVQTGDAGSRDRERERWSQPCVGQTEPGALAPRPPAVPPGLGLPHTHSTVMSAPHHHHHHPGPAAPPLGSRALTPASSQPPHPPCSCHPLLSAPRPAPCRGAPAQWPSALQHGQPALSFALPH